MWRWYNIPLQCLRTARNDRALSLATTRPTTLMAGWQPKHYHLPWLRSIAADARYKMDFRQNNQINIGLMVRLSRAGAIGGALWIVYRSSKAHFMKNVWPGEDKALLHDAACEVYVEEFHVRRDCCCSEKFARSLARSGDQVVSWQFALTAWWTTNMTLRKAWCNLLGSLHLVARYLGTLPHSI